MPKNLKLPFLAVLGVVGVGLVALVVFSGDEEGEQVVADQTEQQSPLLVPAGSVPVLSSPLQEPPVSNMQPSAPDLSMLTLPPQPNTTQPSPMLSQPQPEQSSPSSPQVVTYEIQPGDVISRIAVKYGCKSSEIYDLNDSVSSENAHKIRVGQKIQVLDKRGLGGNSAGAPVEHVSATKSTTSEPQAPTPPALTGSRTHKLKLGDTIFKLAQDYYGSPKHFTLIRKANPDWNPTEVEVGRELVIPALNSDMASVSNSSSNPSRNPIPSRR